MGFNSGFKGLNNEVTRIFRLVCAVRCEMCDIHEQCRKPEVLLPYEVDREDPITDCESFLSKARTPPPSAPVRNICHAIDH